MNPEIFPLSALFGADDPDIDRRDATLGAITSLLLSGNATSKADVATLLRVLSRPISLSMVAVYIDRRYQPVGYVVWAQVSQQVEERLLSGLRALEGADAWSSGDRIWIVDFLSRDMVLFDMIQDFRDRLFRGLDTLAYRRRRKGRILTRRVIRSGSYSLFNAPAPGGRPVPRLGTGGWAGHATGLPTSHRERFRMASVRFELTMMGTALRLAAADPHAASLPLGMLLALVMPALAMGQFATGGAGSKGRDAFVAWAWVTDATLDRWSTAPPQEWHAAEWNAGPSLLIVCRLGDPESVLRLLRDVCGRYPSGTRIFAYDAGGPRGSGRIIDFTVMGCGSGPESLSSGTCGNRG